MVDVAIANVVVQRGERPEDEGEYHQDPGQGISLHATNGNDRQHSADQAEEAKKIDISFEVAALDQVEDRIQERSRGDLDLVSATETGRRLQTW